MLSWNIDFFIGGKPHYLVIEDRTALDDDTYPKLWRLEIKQDVSVFNLEAVLRDRAKNNGEDQF